MHKNRDTYTSSHRLGPQSPRANARMRKTPGSVQTGPNDVCIDVRLAERAERFKPVQALYKDIGFTFRPHLNRRCLPVVNHIFSDAIQLVLVQRSSSLGRNPNIGNWDAQLL
jgi:hypothetical protein